MIDQSKILSIKDLTNYIKSLIDLDPKLQDIWIRGEISNFTHHSSGHMYFTLKDESSRLRSIMFAGNNRYLKFIPKNGMKVIVRGYVSIYERDGQYQFYAQEMEPDGIGQLYLAYEQLKQKLEAEGLFEQKAKKRLPSFPQTIGIITSSTGAAIRDIITTLKRRYPLVNILVYPVLVQGENAAYSIAHAIEEMNRFGGIDLLIIGRGGGSIEELWAFNEEVVARSIFYSDLPVISAVGHETDYTIADFVADVRAATPTAAAELAVPHIDELRASIAYLSKRLERQLLKQFENAKGSLKQILKSTIFKRPKQHLLENAQQIDRFRERLNHSLSKHTSMHRERFSIILQRLTHEKPHERINRNREKIEILKKRLIREAFRKQEKYNSLLSGKIGKLDALSPLKVMKRGYSLLYDEKGKRIIKTVREIQLGDIVKVKLHDGDLDCQVWSLKED